MEINTTISIIINICRKMEKKADNFAVFIYTFLLPGLSLRCRHTSISKLTYIFFQLLDPIELEDMGKSEKRLFLSNLTILIAYLLQLTVQADSPEMIKGSWYGSVTEHRFGFKKDLEENPSFKNYLHEVIFIAYADAHKLAIQESKNAKLGVRKPDETEYALDFPFTLEQLLDEDSYGDNN